MGTISRFAPSPTGYLHLGHAYSAWLGRTHSDIWHLRFEDIDTTRCKPEFASAAQEDLLWLGLAWDGEIRFQSHHFPDYAQALGVLQEKGLLYPCFCTRREIANAQIAPHASGPVYPATCRNLSNSERADKLSNGLPFAIRMDIEKAYHEAGPKYFFDEGSGWVSADPRADGDVILARKDTPTSYHLCAVHDDAAQQISHVIRGEDLRTATHLHVILQALLCYDTPRYYHHKLIKGGDGERLAKRHNAINLRQLRERGHTPADILEKIMVL